MRYPGDPGESRPQLSVVRPTDNAVMSQKSETGTNCERWGKFRVLTGISNM